MRSIHTQTHDGNAIPLVGRSNDLRRLEEMVADPDCRLVTITGIGGVGKTRVATELSKRVAPVFEDGAFIAYAENAVDLNGLYQAIADAAGIRLATAAPLEQRVADWLSETSALLVLDNLEQLTEQGSAVAAIVGLSPGSKVIATSRTPLGIAEEWLYPLDGLSSSSSNDDGASIQLFENVARRSNPAFTIEPGSEVDTHVRQICQLVGGVPLAIEMAGSWIRVLPVDELLHELKRDSQVLISERRDRPPRHQSMQAVFDSSWRMLSDSQRQIYTALAMLRGPFDRQAAMSIANASLKDIGELVDASMLQTDPNGTFICHPVLKRFALEIQDGPKSDDQITHRIASHYSTLAENIFSGSGRSMTELELTHTSDRQIENFRLAMEIASDPLDLDLFRPLLVFFIYSLEFKARYLDGIALMKNALDVLGNTSGAEAEILRAAAISDIGWWHLRLGNTDQALHNADESIAICESIDANLAEFPSTDPTLLRAMVALVTGDSVGARETVEARLADSSGSLNPLASVLAEYLLATIELNDRNLDSARAHANAALRRAEDAGETWFEASCLNLIGDLMVINGNYSEANGYYTRSYSIRSSYDDPVGMGEALIKRGEVSLITGDVDTAMKSFTDAQSALESTGDRGNLGLSDSGLALTLISQSRFEEAVTLLERCLQTAGDLNFQNLRFRSIVALGRLHLAAGNEQLGRNALDVIGAHPQTEFFARTMAGMAHAEHLNETELDRTRITSSPDEKDLGILERTLLDRSILNLQTGEDTVKSTEAFSEREIQILELMADGKTNPEIAEQLIISPGTVKWYSSQIYSRLGVRNRAQAISEARKLAII